MDAKELLRTIPLRVRLPIGGALALLIVGLLAMPFMPAARPGAPARYITIGNDRDPYALGMILQRKRVVRHGFAFALVARFLGANERIRPGTYALSPGQSPAEIVRWLTEGRGQVLRLTVPEGYSIGKIAQLLDAKGLARGAVFRDLAGRPEYFKGRHRWLSDLPPGATLEGFLFPDTYLFDGEQIGEAALIEQMLARFESVIRAEYRNASRPTLSLFEALTLASIIELEAVRAEERPLISGVFQNRLKIGMRLGSDPTVEYALGRHQGSKGLSYKDVKVDSPYNTYRYAGLPPGPIANPGLASFKAALHPQETDYLFFVARGDGSHAFTRTYQDHLAAQRRLRP